MGCPHTSFHKGQKIFIIMKSGARFVVQYLCSKSGVICTEEAGRIAVKDIRTTGIYRKKNAR